MISCGETFTFKAKRGFILGDEDEIELGSTTRPFLIEKVMKEEPKKGLAMTPRWNSFHGSFFLSIPFPPRSDQTSLIINCIRRRRDPPFILMGLRINYIKY